MDRRAVRAFTRELEVGAERIAREGYKEAMRGAVAEEKARVIREQTARSGGTPPQLVQTLVDGKPGADVASVRPSGTVILDWHYLRESAQQAIEELLVHGPQDQGDWKKDIRLLINGSPSTVQAIGPRTEQVVIVPGVAYSRRLEVGKDAQGGAFAVEIPIDFVQATARFLKRNYGDLAKFRFGYVTLDDAYITTDGVAIRAPAIFIDEIGL